MLGRLLGGFGRIWVGSGQVLGRFWAGLGRFWAGFRGIWRGFGAICVYIYIYMYIYIYIALNPLQILLKPAQNLPKTSGGPVRIICTKFRSISMISERVMTQNPSR